MIQIALAEAGGIADQEESHRHSRDTLKGVPYKSSHFLPEAEALVYPASPVREASWAGRKRIPHGVAFLKTAGAAAGTVFMPKSLWAQSPGVEGARSGRPADFPKINQPFMITPDQAWDWNVFKSQGGPTYAGSAGWKRYTDFLLSKMPEFGAVDLDYVEIPYDHYIVDDWPDRRTHMLRLRRGGREARHRRHAGAGRRVVRHDVGLHAARRHHGADAVLRSRASADERSDRREDSRLPDGATTGAALHQLVPRQLHADRLRVAFARQMGAAVHAAAAERDQFLSLPLGLESAEPLRRRSASRATRRASSSSTTCRRARRSGSRSAASTRRRDARASARPTSTVPTLTLDRVNGAKVLADAKAGKMATLTLTRALPARHRQSDHRVSAGQELRHAAGRAGAARHAHRRDVAHRRERRPRHARHHVATSTTSRRRRGRARWSSTSTAATSCRAARRAGRSSTTTPSTPTS